MTKSRWKKSTSYKGKNKNIMKIQQNQSIPSTENKYATLASLQDEQQPSKNHRR
jgi:hypothetical protein